LIARWLGAALLVVLAVGTVLLGRGSRDAARAPDGAAVDDDPGYASRDAVIIETGEDGRPIYRLEAETIRQSPNDMTVTLDALTLTYATSDGALWRASAERGTVPPGGSRIELEGDVRLRGTLRGERTPAEIDTERLTFDADSEVASTAAPVTLRFAGQRLSATGLRADLKAETLRLESNVHGRYAN
jgi:lipopolysaccharide export system protein LptC